MTPWNVREHEQTDGVESLVQGQQYHETGEHCERVPFSKWDVVREHSSDHDPRRTEHQGQQRANNVNGKLANPNLR